MTNDGGTLIRMIKYVHKICNNARRAAVYAIKRTYSPVSRERYEIDLRFVTTLAHAPFNGTVRRIRVSEFKYIFPHFLPYEGLYCQVAATTMMKGDDLLNNVSRSIGTRKSRCSCQMSLYKYLYYDG